MLSKQQELDSKTCIDMSNKGIDKDCLSCSCNICIAQSHLNPISENEQLKAEIKSLKRQLSFLNIK